MHNTTERLTPTFQILFSEDVFEVFTILVRVAENLLHL